MKAHGGAAPSAPGEEVERRGVEPSVAGEHSAVVDGGAAGEIRQAPTRFLDEGLDGRDVPGLEIALPKLSTMAASLSL